ncbi:Alpha,alpha-trehalose-phosphate synthase [UDP-forming] [Candidatus Paraburkholderia kirkii]|nr:Alpha,alpha-trehalose-phosphate synthase [UDP-forming] [Candidatus Paraburkholderia kirkii]
MSRLIIVSNRVAPISEGGPAAGGLAVGVYDALKETGGMWFGWSGDVFATPPDGITLEEHGPVTFATIGLVRRDYDQYYRGFSSATLWPAFHYRPDLIEFDRHEYDGYCRVNRWLAAQLAPLLKPDDVIWVHDYHLIPFAQALRALGVRNRIGFFLHIPFPAPQILLSVPRHRELMEALCAFDLLGFQTGPDLRAFCDYIETEAGGTLGRDDAQPVEIRAFGQTLRAAAYPIGVYPDEIAALAKDCEDGHGVQIVKATLHERKLVMSVDRLDYSKGLVEHFRAFERLIEHDPHQRNNVSFLQIAPPTRSDVDAYRDIRLQLEAESGRINGRYTELDWTPIRYILAIRAAGAGRVVLRGARGTRHAAARRHESRGEGIRVGAGSRRSRCARAVAVRGRGARADGRADRQSARHRRHGRRRARHGAQDAAGGAQGALRRDVRTIAREQRVGVARQLPAGPENGLIAAQA